LAAARSLVSRGEHQLVASISRQLDAFAAAVRGEPADGLATAEDGVAVMAALEAARRSARAGGTWVDVTPG
jgi:predicted dehydrogenase